MSPAGHPFWWLLTGAVLAWYATVTVVVAWRGLTEVRQMLRALAPESEARTGEERES